MTGRSSDGRRPSTGGKTHTGRRRLLRGPRAVLAAALAVVGLGAAATSAIAIDGTVTLPGSPLVVSVGTLGECQSSYPNVGSANFYRPTQTLGDCGFFLAFPSGVGNPPALEQAGKTGSVFGFEGEAGPKLVGSTGGVLFTSIKQDAATGSGTAADPYSEVTTLKATTAGLDYALVTVTTTYVNGAADFTSKYDVQNLTGTPEAGGLKPAPAATLHFHAIEAGDLYVANSDAGTGLFLGGPPRFIGGQNVTTGTLGGFIEASPEWTNYQEGGYDEPIWEAVRKSTAATPVFDNSIDPNLLDNGIGVSWDQFLTPGLPAGQHAVFSIVNRSQVPTTLGVQPVSQTHTVGQTATVTVTATDNIGTPYSGRTLVYSIGGANPKTGSVTTDGAGVATISYVGTAAGLDTMQMFLDLNGNGSGDTAEPSSAAQIAWAPLPPAPAPDSSYKIGAIHANSDGTITITFVPTQNGTAVMEVTVPTGTISRKQAEAARKKKCKKNQIKIHGKCKPKNTLSGKITAKGKAGVALKLTVKPSSKVKKALKKGKKVSLTAKLTYKSVLGGKPTVKSFHLTVKPKKKKKR